MNDTKRNLGDVEQYEVNTVMLRPWQACQISRTFVCLGPEVERLEFVVIRDIGNVLEIHNDIVRSQEIIDELKRQKEREKQKAIRIGQLPTFEVHKADIKQGDVWQIGRSFIWFDSNQRATLEIVRDVGDVTRRRKHVIVTDEDIMQIKGF